MTASEGAQQIVAVPAFKNSADLQQWASEADVVAGHWKNAEDAQEARDAARHVEQDTKRKRESAEMVEQDAKRKRQSAQKAEQEAKRNRESAEREYESKRALFDNGAAAHKFVF